MIYWNCRRLRCVVLSCLLISLLSACATAPPSLPTDRNAPTTFDGLVSIQNPVFDQAWARPDIDLSSYSAIMFRGTGIQYRPARARAERARRAGTGYVVDEQAQQRLERLLTEEFRRELIQVTAFDLVDAPGPDTLLLEIGLLDVVSNVTPPGVGREWVFISEVGSATLVVELKDSLTGTTLARALDQRAAESPGGELELSSKPNNWREVRRLAQRWAKLMRQRIDALADA